MSTRDDSAGSPTGGDPMPVDDRRVLSHDASLTRSDAWLLAAMLERDDLLAPVSIGELIERADWLKTALPSYDELSFGLPRLIAADLITVDVGIDGRLAIRTTNRAASLQPLAAYSSGGTRGDVLAHMAEALGARPYPETEKEDRSLGRLAGLDAQEVEDALDAYTADFFDTRL